MKHQNYKFAIFGNSYQTEKSAFVKQVIHELEIHGAKIKIEREFFEYLQHNLNINFDVDEIFEGNDFFADFAISLGGDGTFLKAAMAVGCKDIPIIGINIGRLGFMADVSPDEIGGIFKAIYENDYTIEERSVIRIEDSEGILTEYPYALNEIAVLKQDNSSMIAISTYVDDEFLTRYQADGLIVCTPTGSTGYSLSVNGPIIAPNSASLAITAVAPHSLTVRPIVLRDDVEICLAIESRSHNYLVAIDGRSQSCPASTALRIKKANFSIKIVKRSHKNFFDTLREKLMWGVDQRV